MFRDIIRQDKKNIFFNESEHGRVGRLLYQSGDVEEINYNNGNEGYGLNMTQYGMSDNATFFIDTENRDGEEIAPPKYNDKFIDDNGTSWMVERTISNEEGMIHIACRAGERTKN